MTATDELRKLLDERGMDYRLHRASATSARETVYWEYERDGEWRTAEYAVTIGLDGYGTLNASQLTPAQAIAATLGSWECETANRDELIRDLWDEVRHSGSCMIPDYINRMREIGIEVVGR